MLTIHLYLIHSIIGYYHGEAQTVIFYFKILLMIFHVTILRTSVLDATSSVCGDEIVV